MMGHKKTFFFLSCLCFLVAGFCWNISESYPLVADTYYKSDIVAVPADLVETYTKDVGQGTRAKTKYYVRYYYFNPLKQKRSRRRTVVDNYSLWRSIDAGEIPLVIEYVIKSELNFDFGGMKAPENRKISARVQGDSRDLQAISRPDDILVMSRIVAVLSIILAVICMLKLFRYTLPSDDEIFQ